jgi:anti-sigma factor RsiW
LNCRFSEELLALYVEGDLSSAQAGKVEHHLNRCAKCREITAELRDSLDLFKTFRGYGIDAGDVADVRRRVHREVQNAEIGSPGLVLQLERAFYAGLRRKWVLAGSGAVVCVLIAAAMWSVVESGRPPATSHQVANVPPLPSPPVAVAPATAVASVQPLAGAPPRNRPPKRQAAAAVEAVEKDQPKEIFVKVFTDDPNIVIYWFLEQKGEME